jgi:hypothetical protein
VLSLLLTVGPTLLLAALLRALVFRAFQTYEGGEKVSWTGPKNADEPAPRVTLTAPVTPTATAAHAPIKTLSPKAGAHASTSLRHVTATFKEAIVSGSLNVYQGRTKVSIGKAALLRMFTLS